MTTHTKQMRRGITQQSKTWGTVSSRKVLVSVFDLFQKKTCMLTLAHSGLEFAFNLRYLFFKKRFYPFIFLERGREGEREGEKYQYVVVSQASPTGDLACNPGMCPDRQSNQRLFGSQAGTQPTELHQPGLI